VCRSSALSIKKKQGQRMTVTQHFRSGLFEFLAELKANNDREWFNANKQRFVDEVEAPMLRFIADFGEQNAEGEQELRRGSPEGRRFDVSNLSRHAILEG